MTGDRTSPIASRTVLLRSNGRQRKYRVSSPDSLKTSLHSIHRHDLVWNSGLVVTNSAIHGRGIFASRVFRKGDSIARLTGRIIRGSDALSDPDYIGIGPDTWIDPDLPFSTINHSCSPTAGFGRRRYIYALDDLVPGQEVTIDYSTTEADLDWEMSCECGASNCRQTLRAIHFAYPDKDFPPVASPLMMRVWRNRLDRAAMPFTACLR
jgi:SET domain